MKVENDGGKDRKRSLYEEKDFIVGNGSGYAGIQPGFCWMRKQWV